MESDLQRPLTERETEVAVLIGTGFSNKYVARHLGVSPRTVEAQLASVYLKLEVSSRDELIEWLSGVPD